MRKALIIGANGKIGRQLVRMMVENGLPVRAMVRKPEQLEEYEKIGAEAVLGDLEKDFSEAFEGCDKVVFSAGSGSATGADKTLLIDLWGAIKAVDFARQKGIDHFIMISSMNSADPDSGPVAIKHYLVAKFAADEYLKNSGLEYSILRPARLIDDPGTGKIRTDRTDNADERIIPRADVAAAALYCLKTDSTRGLIVDLRQGEAPLDKVLEGHR